MGALRRLARLIWSDDVDPALRPVLGVTLASTAAGSAMWSFMAIWAVDELGAKRELPYALLVGALLAGLSGFLGGYLSDRIGRRRVMLVGQGIMVGYPIVLLLLSTSKWAALSALALAGAFGSLGGSTAQAMVADLVAPARREAAYASVRVAANLGVVAGPPIGGQQLLLGSWPPLFPTVATLSAAAWVIAYRFLPTSQAVVAALAPQDIRGAYMGAFGSAPAIGFALAPLIGLQVRNSFGDDATWTMFACIGVVAAALGGLALAGMRRRIRHRPSAVLEA